MTPETVLAVLALLVSPGPTNTLMILAGAEGGARAVWPLILRALAAYLLAVGPLLLAAAVLPDLPALRALVTVAAGLWVARLALGLWRLPAGAEAPAAVTPGRIFATTLLNPKALIFGLVLLPGSGAAGLAVLAAGICAASALWGLGGACLARQGRGQACLMPRLRRGAALVLAVFALVLLIRGTGLFSALLLA